MFNQRLLYCIQWPERDQFELYGSFAGSKYAAIDIMLVSCNSWIKPSYDDTDNENCVQNQAEAEKYLGNRVNLIFYYNQHRFDQKKFGDERIQKKSVLSMIWTPIQQPIFTQTFVNKSELQDEVSMLQLGDQDLISFESVNFGAKSPSSYNEWPTKEKPAKTYKYNSIFLELNQEKIMIER